MQGLAEYCKALAALQGMTGHRDETLWNLKGHLQKYNIKSFASLMKPLLHAIAKHCNALQGIARKPFGILNEIQNRKKYPVEPFAFLRKSFCRALEGTAGGLKDIAMKSLRI